MRSKRFYHAAWRWVVRFLLRVFMIRWRIVHPERLQKVQGGFLLASNHISNLDPALLNLLPVHVNFMAKKSLKQLPVFGWCMEKAGHFAINRGVPDSRSIRHALDILAQGGGVGMFPEGTRSRDGVLQSGKPGAGMLACRANVPVIPVAIIGAADILPKGKLVPRVSDVVIRVGEPLRLDDLLQNPPEDRDAEREQYQQAVDRIMAAIGELLREEEEEAAGGERRAAGAGEEEEHRASRIAHSAEGEEEGTPDTEH